MLVKKDNKEGHALWCVFCKVAINQTLCIHTFVHHIQLH